MVSIKDLINKVFIVLAETWVTQVMIQIAENTACFPNGEVLSLSLWLSVLLFVKLGLSCNVMFLFLTDKQKGM